MRSPRPRCARRGLHREAGEVRPERRHPLLAGLLHPAARGVGDDDLLRQALERRVDRKLSGTSDGGIRRCVPLFLFPGRRSKDVRRNGRAAGRRGGPPRRLPAGARASAPRRSSRTCRPVPAHSGRVPRAGGTTNGRRSRVIARWDRRTLRNRLHPRPPLGCWLRHLRPLLVCRGKLGP